VADDTHVPRLGYADVPPAGVILDYVRRPERFGGQPEPVTLVHSVPHQPGSVLRANPGLVRDKVSRHVAMIHIEAAGNQTRFSEFNAWCDPEALATVLAAEIRPR